jgi:hypothetical protein
MLYLVFFQQSASKTHRRVSPIMHLTWNGVNGVFWCIENSKSVNDLSNCGWAKTEWDDTLDVCSYRSVQLNFTSLLVTWCCCLLNAASCPATNVTGLRGRRLLYRLCFRPLDVLDYFNVAFVRQRLRVPWPHVLNVTWTANVHFSAISLKFASPGPFED